MWVHTWPSLQNTLGDKNQEVGSKFQKREVDPPMPPKMGKGLIYSSFIRTQLDSV